MDEMLKSDWRPWVDKQTETYPMMRTVRLALELLVLAAATEVRAQADPQDGGSDAHLVLGGSLGYPILLNAVAGVDAWRVTARISGAYYALDTNGVQLEVGSHLFTAGPTRLAVLAGLGAANYPGIDGPSSYYSYTSLGFRVDWRGLFLSQGFSYRLHGTNDFDDGTRPGYFFSLGYAVSIGL